MLGDFVVTLADVFHVLVDFARMDSEELFGFLTGRHVNLLIVDRRERDERCVETRGAGERSGSVAALGDVIAMVFS